MTITGKKFCIIFADPECYDYVKRTKKRSKSQSTNDSPDVSRDSYTTRYASMTLRENAPPHLETNLRLILFYNLKNNKSD